MKWKKEEGIGMGVRYLYRLHSHIYSHICPFFLPSSFFDNSGEPQGKWKLIWGLIELDMF